jgi:hypothetical protein
MKKAKPTIFTVNKRFIVWVSTTVDAANFHEALDKANALKPSDFMDIEELIDFDPLPGTSVAEDWS